MLYISCLTFLLTMIKMNAGPHTRNLKQKLNQQPIQSLSTLGPCQPYLTHGRKYRASKSWPVDIQCVSASHLLNTLAQHLIYILATTLATLLFTAWPNPI